MARSIGTRYPRGGSNQWIGPSPGAVVLRAEFFGAEPSGVVANITGAQVAAQAGTLVARGVADATLTGAQATAQAGAPIGRGAGSASVSGTQAQAQAGTLTAVGASAATAEVEGAQVTVRAGNVTAREGGVTPEPAPRRFGGGRKKWRMPAMAPSIPSIYTPPTEPVPVPARVAIPSAAAFTVAGKLFARGAHSAKARIVGAAAAGAALEIKASGRARIMIKAAVIGANPATAGMVGAQASALPVQLKAKGLGFSDAELAAILEAMAEAA
jgi:hypothetical protein